GWWSDKDKKYVERWDRKDSPTFTRLSAGPIQLALHARHVPNGIDNPIDPRGCVFHLKVNDIDEFCRSIKMRGATVTEPVNQFWNWRTLTVRDPDGHQWEFYSQITDEVRRSRIASQTSKPLGVK